MEKTLINKKLILNFLNVSTYKGLINQDIREIEKKIENNINEYKDALKERYLEFGAILHEIENDFIND